MKDVKENSVQWTDWDSNRECHQFDKVAGPQPAWDTRRGEEFSERCL